MANVTEKYKKLVMGLAGLNHVRLQEAGNTVSSWSSRPPRSTSRGSWTWAAKRAQTTAIVNEDTLFTKTTSDATAELAKKHGPQVLFKEAYPKGNRDFSAILTKVKAANPDVFAAATYFDDAVAITRQMKELDVTPR